jgi:hypothetical protein
MFDVTFLIPDYPNWWDDGSDYVPPAPDDVMPDRERERIEMEIFELIDAGAFDPERELPF